MQEEGKQRNSGQELQVEGSFVHELDERLHFTKLSASTTSEPSERRKLIVVGNSANGTPPENPKK